MCQNIPRYLTILFCLAPTILPAAPGDILTSFVPDTGAPACNMGLTFDGEYLWLTQSDSSLIYQLTTDNQLVRTIEPLPGRILGALAWDGEHLWAGTADQAPDTIVEIDPGGNGTVLHSFPVPFVNQPFGYGIGGLA